MFRSVALMQVSISLAGLKKQKPITGIQLYSQSYWNFKSGAEILYGVKKPEITSPFGNTSHKSVQK